MVSEHGGGWSVTSKKPPADAFCGVTFATLKTPSSYRYIPRYLINASLSWCDSPRKSNMAVGAGTTTTVATSASQTFAPLHEIGPSPLASIEHPCIIKNVDRGIQSLGGHRSIEKVGIYSSGIYIHALIFF